MNRSLQLKPDNCSGMLCSHHGNFRAKWEILARMLTTWKAWMAKHLRAPGTQLHSLYFVLRILWAFNQVSVLGSFHSQLDTNRIALESWLFVCLFVFPKLRVLYNIFWSHLHSQLFPDPPSLPYTFKLVLFFFVLKNLKDQFVLLKYLGKECYWSII